MEFRQARSVAEIELPWARLLQQNHFRAVFLSPYWQDAWLRHIGASRGEPLLLYATDDGAVTGVAPLLKQGDTVTFLGEPDLYDYCDFLIARGQEVPFLTHLLAEMERRGWREMRLFSIPEGSVTLSVLPDLARERGLQVSVEEEAVCPGVALPATWEEYLASLSRKDRHEVRRKLRRLYGNLPADFVEVREADEVEAQMDSFLALMRNSREDKRTFLTPEREAFFRDTAFIFARLGCLRLFFLRTPEEEVSATLCFDYNGDRALYNSGYERKYASLSVGLMVKVLALKDAIEKGKRYFDFLKGQERYKYDLGAVDRKVFTLKVAQ